MNSFAAKALAGTALLGCHKTNPTYFNASNTTFITLLHNLGPGLLRVGANSVDKNFWSGRPRRAATPAGSSTTTDADCFAPFVQQRHLLVDYVVDLNAYYAAIHPLLPATASASAA